MKINVERVSICRRAVRGVSALAAVPLLCLLPVGASGQWLHDARGAGTSEEAARRAREIPGPERYAKQLETLDQLEKASADRVFAGTRLQMDRGLLSLRRWSSLGAFMQDVEASLGEASEVAPVLWTVQRETLAQAMESAADQRTALISALRACGKSTDEGTLSRWLARLGRLEAIGDEVRRVTGLPNPVRAHAAVLTQLAGTFQAIESLYRGARSTLPATAVEQEAIERRIEALASEEAHLEQLGVIAARREAEIAELQAICRTARTQLAAIPAGVLEMDVLSSLQLATRDVRELRVMFLSDPTEAETRRRYLARQSELRTMLSLLLNASALAARNETPSRVAMLRTAEQTRRESVRRSAMAASGYQQLLVRGAERLSVHYQGGLRWETLSRVLQAAASMGLLPAAVLR